MTLSLQFFSLLSMLTSGVLIGAIIEGTRFLTGVFSKRSFIFKYRIGIEIIVWILLGLGTFYVLYEVRDGIWRIYDPLAQLVGILLYEQLFQPVFRFVGRIFITLIIKPIWFIIRIFLMIISKILRFILLILITIAHPFRYLYKKTLRWTLQKKTKLSYNKKYTKN